MIISATHSASCYAVPTHKKNYQNFWWDQYISLNGLMLENLGVAPFSWLAIKPNILIGLRKETQRKEKKLPISDKLQNYLCNKNTKSILIANGKHGNPNLRLSIICRQ